VRVQRVGLRDFRNYAAAEVELGEGLTVVHGPNGAGKSNLLEGLYFGCTARSSRTANERELVRFDAALTRVSVELTGDDQVDHVLEVGFAPGEPKRIRVDGAAVERLADHPVRPLVAVFVPERLELIKGAPSARRAHLDAVVAALWPARAPTRAEYGRALAQRNALLARVRAGAAPTLLDPWDAELARHGIALMADREAAVELLAGPFRARAAELGLPADAGLIYRPRSRAADAEALRTELAERRAGDVERGFSGHGPHRDDVLLVHGGAALRPFGSQGQQRTALLALLFAERDVLIDQRGRAPLMLLDDVMSELDEHRRRRLADLVRAGGQAVVTTTEAEHVPGATDPDVHLVEVADGRAELRAAEPGARA
jgi:DNA replication and repair protein RecF